MPDRAMVMMSVRDYLQARERAREPPPILDAIIAGAFLVIVGGLAITLSLVLSLEDRFTPFYCGSMLTQLGAAFVILGMKGGARYRVTETTRYPQQTGQLGDMFFQVCGGEFLWIQVGIVGAWVLALAIIV